MSRRHLWLGAMLCLLATPFLGAIGRSESGKRVDVAAAGPREIKSSVLASGSLIYQEQSQLSPEIIGQVSAILVKEGEHVSAGQIVLQIDDGSFKADVADKAAAAGFQRADVEHQRINVAQRREAFERIETLTKREVMSRAAYDDARFALDMAAVDLRKSEEALKQAEALLEHATEQLAKTSIRAPIAGTVIAIGIKVGETAVPSTIGIAGSNLMTIANTETITGEFNVDEADISRVAPGQEVEIHAAAYPDRPLNGVVKEIALAPKRNDGVLSMGGPSSLARTYSVQAALRGVTGYALRPGMSCRAEIFTSSAGDALAIPVQAIIDTESDRTAPRGRDHAGRRDAEDTEQYVFVAENGVARRKPVHMGRSDDAYVEILAGLSRGDSVITGPSKVLRYLSDGESIRAEAAGHSS